MRPLPEKLAISWDDVRVFAKVAELGSMKAASRALGMTINTVRRRLATFETQMDAVLLNRTAKGVELTPEGRSVFDIAVEMSEHSVALQHLSQRHSHAASGIVRLAVTEGLGAFWLTPHLVAFQRENSRIKLDVRHDMRIPDLSRLECDVAVQLLRPRDDSLIVRRLGYLHLMVYGSRAYIAKHGQPSTFSQMEKFSFVHQVAEQIPSAMLQELVRSDPMMHYVSIIVNTASAQVLALFNNAGFGVLPTYTSALTDDLVPVRTDFQMRREVWLVYHPEAGKLARVRRLIRAITAAFDPGRYPWFREEFVDPSEFAVADRPLFD
ncbi:LysR family transcriptional regulator [Consotaella aegiceratis]|uniref:LysR family transcriptional regulator n=1 Tax=Consotaella aegiceratis TaxID=3097961 RepID=UPI002F41009E